MLYDRSYIEKFIARFVHPVRPELDSPLLNVFDALVSGSAISSQTLPMLVDAASDRRANVYEISTEFLGELAERDVNALEMIRNMLTSKHAHVRHNAILCLSSGIDSNISAEIIREGLGDKSSFVRRKAADWAHRLLLRDVSSDLSKALEAESNAETSDVMRDALKAIQGRKMQ